MALTLQKKAEAVLRAECAFLHFLDSLCRTCHCRNPPYEAGYFPITLSLKWEEHYVDRVNAHHSNRNVQIFGGQI